MRTLAILGRPNVGKSTLFNRLTGSRRALVHDMPGVTRDRLEAKGRLGELEFNVIDTAGMDVGDTGGLEARLTAQSLAGLAEADVGILLVDAKGGITGLDADLAKMLRCKAGKPILLVANKAESRAAQSGIGEAWSLGLGEPIAISAEHGDGMPDLLAALRPYLAPPPTEAEDGEERAVLGQDEDEADDGDDWFRLAVVGRPNVGKSSLINRLLQSERLLTGPEPGLTRDSVQVMFEWQGKRIELVDTAGLRRKARIDHQVEKLSASSTVRSIRGAHVVLLLVDATAPLEHQDLTIANLALDEGRALVVAANKWDLIEEPEEALSELRYKIEEKLAQIKGVELAVVSAKTGRGLDRLLEAATVAHARWRKRIPTHKLNQWLHAALERHPPPMAQNRRIKIRFMTQVATRPPRFALFANKSADMLPESYLRYLAAGLREAFDLDGAPLHLMVRHGENPYDKK
ncbi:GTP-binding protein [Arboricoccus pini]|uniref:GTPase Der n=1 Tax=Arboricoccus pini TaxID=1963835 RepID=A0A212QWX3_9PROT|nr:ribosome biogenesis GTPase Der [Arboricoccus pini]SNB64234.1 GTP-binding protein [Arboricoccus pini]